MRRLSAIMFTDMVGYSRLTQENEALALDLLEEHRAILRPFFNKHEGREIETAGDSFFVEFNSAVEAANCAIEIQTALYERNKMVSSERQIQIRIGLHIGDVVYVEEHVHGDGVNIAARMEPLAKPGGICVSEDVARQIRNKVGFPVKNLGRGKLKNIAIPMDVYCILLPWLNSDPNHVRPFAVKRSAIYILTVFIVLSVAGFFFSSYYKSTAKSYSKYRLAVLPLANISNGGEDEYFVDGMTEELISTLAQIGGLNVIARTSIMKYKGLDKNIAEIGKELMVGTILEGSVRKFENQARITIQLIDVTTQEHIWSQDFDRELKDIFKVQSEIAQNVANELKVRLVSSEKEQLDKTFTDNTSAFQEYLIGKHLLNIKTRESIRVALVHFERSIEHDPQFSLPYASLAYCYTLIGAAGYGNVPRDMAEKKAKEYVNKALAIDSTLAEAHAALGYIRFRIDWDWKGAEEEFKKAIALKPNYATAHEWYALFLSLHNRHNEGLEEMKKALELDPLSPGVNTGLARIYFFRGEFDKSIAQCEKTLLMDPTYAEAYFALGMTYNVVNQNEQALINLKKAAEFSHDRPVILGFLGHLYAKTGNTDEAKKILTKLESPPINNDKLYASSFIKLGLGQTEEALDAMEKLLEERYGILVYMNVDNGMLNLRNNPRFLSMLKRMGFE